MHETLKAAQDKALKISKIQKLPIRYPKQKNMITEKEITAAATAYAEEQNSCYTNDLNGFEAGARWLLEEFSKAGVMLHTPTTTSQLEEKCGNCVFWKPVHGHPNEGTTLKDIVGHVCSYGGQLTVNNNPDEMCEAFSPDEEVAR